MSAVVLIALLIGGMRYRLDHYVPGKVTFQEYAPAYLPQGVSVQKKSIEAWYIPSQQPSHYTMVNVQLSEGFIYMRKNDIGFSYNCENGAVMGQACAVTTTPGGQRYILTTVTEYTNGETEQILSWLKNGTLIRLSITSLQGEYSRTELGRIVDSFQKVHYRGLPVEYIDKSKI